MDLELSPQRLHTRNARRALARQSAGRYSPTGRLRRAPLAHPHSPAAGTAAQRRPWSAGASPPRTRAATFSSSAPFVSFVPPSAPPPRRSSPSHPRVSPRDLGGQPGGSYSGFLVFEHDSGDRLAVAPAPDFHPRRARSVASEQRPLARAASPESLLLREARHSADIYTALQKRLARTPLDIPRAQLTSSPATVLLERTPGSRDPPYRFPPGLGYGSDLPRSFIETGVAFGSTRPLPEEPLVHEARRAGLAAAGSGARAIPRLIAAPDEAAVQTDSPLADPRPSPADFSVSMDFSDMPMPWAHEQAGDAATGGQQQGQRQQQQQQGQRRLQQQRSGLGLSASARGRGRARTRAARRASPVRPRVAARRTPPASPSPTGPRHTCYLHSPQKHVVCPACEARRGELGSPYRFRTSLPHAPRVRAQVTPSVVEISPEGRRKQARRSPPHRGAPAKPAGSSPDGRRTEHYCLEGVIMERLRTQFREGSVPESHESVWKEVESGHIPQELLSQYFGYGASPRTMAKLMQSRLIGQTEGHFGAAGVSIEDTQSCSSEGSDRSDDGQDGSSEGSGAAVDELLLVPESHGTLRQVVDRCIGIMKTFPRRSPPESPEDGSAKPQAAPKKVKKRRKKKKAKKRIPKPASAPPPAPDMHETSQTADEAPQSSSNSDSGNAYGIIMEANMDPIIIAEPRVVIQPRARPDEGAEEEQAAAQSESATAKKPRKKKKARKGEKSGQIQIDGTHIPKPSVVQPKSDPPSVTQSPVETPAQSQSIELQLPRLSPQTRFEPVDVETPAESDSDGSSVDSGDGSDHDLTHAASSSVLQDTLARTQQRASSQALPSSPRGWDESPLYSPQSNRDSAGMLVPHPSLVFGSTGKLVMASEGPLTQKDAIGPSGPQCTVKEVTMEDKFPQRVGTASFGLFSMGNATQKVSPARPIQRIRPGGAPMKSAALVVGSSPTSPPRQLQPSSDGLSLEMVPSFSSQTIRASIAGTEPSETKPQAIPDAPMRTSFPVPNHVLADLGIIQGTSVTSSPHTSGHSGRPSSAVGRHSASEEHSLDSADVPRPPAHTPRANRSGRSRLQSSPSARSGYRGQTPARILPHPVGFIDTSRFVRHFKRHGVDGPYAALGQPDSDSDDDQMDGIPRASLFVDNSPQFRRHVEQSAAQLQRRTDRSESIRGWEQSGR